MLRSAVEKLLETYSFEEVLELNDLTEIDVLQILLKHRHINLPEILPVDLW